MTENPDPHAEAASVRSARPDDLAAIASVDAAVFGVDRLSYPYFVLRQFFDVFRDRCLVVEAGGQVRGYALIGVRAGRGDVLLLAYGVEPGRPALAAALRSRVGEFFTEMPVSPDVTAYKMFGDSTVPSGIHPRLVPDGPGDGVRMAVDADLPRLAVVDRAVFCELTYPYFVLCQLFALFQDYCVVAHSEGEVCGYALIGVTRDRSTAWLLGLGVVPDRRGRGLGARLLDQAVELCRGVPVDEVKITVRPTNEEAERIYKRAGFVQEDYEEEYFGEGEPRRLLHLLLNGWRHQRRTSSAKKIVKVM